MKRIYAGQVYFGLIATLIAQAGCTKVPGSKDEKGPDHKGDKEITGAPSIRSVYPKEGTSRGDVLIHISVGNISKNATITLNDTPCTLAEIYEHSETAFCHTSPHSPAKADLKVTNPSGEYDTLSQAFEFVKDPSDLQKELKQQAEKEKEHLAHQLREIERKHQAELQKLKQENLTKEREEQERRRLVDQKHQQEAAANQAEKTRLDRIRIAQEQTARDQDQQRRNNQNDLGALGRLRAQLGADQAAFDRQNQDLAAARQRLAQDQADLARLRDQVACGLANLRAREETYQRDLRAAGADRQVLAQEQARIAEDRRALDDHRAQLTQREERLAQDEQNVQDTLEAVQIQQDELNVLLARHRAVEQQHAQARIEEEQRNHRAQAQAVLDRLQAEEAARNAAPVVQAGDAQQLPENPPVAQPVAAPWQVRSPDFQHNGPILSAQQLTEHREHIEDFSRLFIASGSEFRAQLQNPIHTQFGDLRTHAHEANAKALSYLQAPQLAQYVAAHTTEYQGVRYRVNFDLLVQDPYRFIEKDLTSLEQLPEVTDARLAELKQLLLHNLQVDGRDAQEIAANRQRRTQVLTDMLRHYDIVQPITPEVRLRKLNLRKRLNRIVETINLHAAPGQEQHEQLGLLATIMEGDIVDHCLDGLQTQANAADAHFLGMAVEPKSLGDHISRTLRYYRTQFIERHRLLYNAMSGDFDEKEAHTYAPIGLMRTMMLTLGLLTDLEPVAHAFYFPGNNTDLPQARKDLVKPAAVMERFLEGRTHITAFGTQVKFEAYDPKLMLHLLDLTARRGVSRAALRQDPEARDNRGLKITPTYIQGLFMPAHPTDFARQNPEFAHALKEDFENFFAELPNEGDQSRYFKMIKESQVIPNEAFWTEMLIHYGYIVRAQ